MKTLELTVMQQRDSFAQDKKLLHGVQWLLNFIKVKIHKSRQVS